MEEADGLFKEYIANTYTTNVPLLCLLVYRSVLPIIHVQGSHSCEGAQFKGFLRIFSEGNNKN